MLCQRYCRQRGTVVDGERRRRVKCHGKRFARRCIVGAWTHRAWHGFKHASQQQHYAKRKCTRIHRICVCNGKWCTEKGHVGQKSVKMQTRHLTITMLARTDYPLRRAEVESCRVGKHGTPMLQALGEWSFCMLIGATASKRPVRDAQGITYHVEVVDSLWQDLVLPVDKIPAVDWLVLMSVHDARCPRLRLGPTSACGDDFFDIVTPNDKDWVATFHGAVRRSQFETRGERLDRDKFPLDSTLVIRKNKPINPFSNREECAFRLWRAPSLKDLQ